MSGTIALVGAGEFLEGMADVDRTSANGRVYERALSLELLHHQCRR